MLGVFTRRFRYPQLASSAGPRSSSLRPFSSKPWNTGNSPTPSEEELDAAREWLDRLSPKSIPRNICKVSYSTSGGPGGQAVNKSNTKATLTVSADALLPLVPKILHDSVRSSRYFAKASESLVIQSQESRSRTANQNRCYEKLLEVLADAGDGAIPGKTSLEQLEKVKRLQASEKEARLRRKKEQSRKKQDRKASRFDD